MTLDNFQIPQKTSSWNDMLVLYSTIPGYCSWRNSSQGTYLVQSLCKILFNHSCHMDLEEMLKKVNRDLQKKVAQGKFKQGCEYVNRGFNKKLYFNHIGKDDSTRKQ